MLPIYVIHKPDPARRKHIEWELGKLQAGLECSWGFEYAQEPAQGYQCNNMRRNPRGEWGCALSHLKAIGRALALGFDRALFIEDDVIFAAHAGTLLDQTLRTVGHFRILYLGGHPRGAVQSTDWPGLVRPANGFSCAEAYILDRQAMGDFLAFWCDRAGQPNAMIDFILGEYAASQERAFAFYPTLTEQMPGFSHIGQKHDDKRELIRRGWQTNLFIK